MLPKTFVRLFLCFTVSVLASAGIPAHLTACQQNRCFGGRAASELLQVPLRQTVAAVIGSGWAGKNSDHYWQYMSVDGENQNSPCFMDFALLSGG
jgi:hypothetical protein